MNNLRNQVQLIGRLGQDPEIMTFDSGKKRAKLSMATNETYKDAQGNKVSHTDWHQVIFWGKTVDVIEQYVIKGNEIAVKGKLSYRDYEDENGNKKYVTEIIGQDLLLLGH